MSEKLDCSQMGEEIDVSVQECEELLACDSAHPVSSGLLSSKSRRLGEWIASRPWGQMIFKSVDRILWCIERTMLWQNPNPDALVPMVRPVNAVLAYPLAALLWVLQHLMFVTTETSSANELIKWVQTRRRRLRAVRFQGIRNMRSKKELDGPVTESPKRFEYLYWLLGRNVRSDKQIVCETHTIKDDSQEDVTTEQDDSDHNKKRRYSTLSLSADEGPLIIDGEEYHSESDSDYVPDCSLSSESSDSDLSSVEEDEETAGSKLNETVPMEKTDNHQTSPEKNGQTPSPKN